MLLFSEIAFWFCWAALLHSYLLYPALLAWWSRNRAYLPPPALPDEELPFVSVLMSAYNEEKVLSEKVRSLTALQYPAGKLAFFFGSDASRDATDHMLREAAASDERIHFFPFPQRRGKPAVLNDLAERALLARPAGPMHLFLLTDANVILSPDVLLRLTRHFRDPQMALVDAHMINTGMKKEGISRSEDRYISQEVWIKHREGQLWGAMIGPFGGCYALRTDYFHPVPSHYLVDDFYIAMRALEQGGKAINDLDAHCFEAVSHRLREEYRRKRRIAAGNFQNLLTFFHLWFPPVGRIRFAFFSHKVLRWLGPWWMLGGLLSSACLGWNGNLFYLALFFLQLTGFVGLPLVDRLLENWNLHWAPLRNIRYFVSMNLALMEGLFKFLGGIKGGAWEPPQRV